MYSASHQVILITLNYKYIQINIKRVLDVET